MSKYYELGKGSDCNLYLKIIKYKIGGSGERMAYNPVEKTVYDYLPDSVRTREEIKKYITRLNKELLEEIQKLYPIFTPTEAIKRYIKSYSCY